MFKLPKALTEINKIQEKIFKKRKITDKDFVEKTRRAVDSIRQKSAVKISV